MLGSDKIQMMPVKHDSEGIFDFYKNYLDKNVNIPIILLI